MKRLIALTTIVLSCSAIVFVAGPSAMAQRGGHFESRTLTGHVVNDQDEPAGKAVVYLKNTKSLAIKTYITDSDGNYHFPAIAPNVDYEVHAERDGARSDVKTLSGFDSRKQVNINLKIHGK